MHILKEKISETRSKVITVYFNSEGIPQEILNNCVEVDFVPESPNNFSTLYMNEETNELYWGVDTTQPISLEERIKLAEEKNEKLETQLAQTNADFATFMEYVFNNGGV